MSTGADIRPADPAPGLTDNRAAARWDLVLGAAGVLLVVAAGTAAHLLSTDPRGNLTSTVAPLLANWMPHVGPGSPFAVVIAVAAVTWGPAVAQRLSWRQLLGVTYATTLIWSMSLALVDGWQRGFAGRLTSDDEYLAEVPRVSDVHQMLQTFTTHIIDYQPGRWTTHVAAHPPGAFLVYVGLDRIGLGGGTFASLFTWAVGCSAGVAVLVTVRVLARRGDSPDGEQLGRRAAPFLALAPAADVSGLSRSETERIWLPFGVWLLAATALRPVRHQRAWLATGVVLALGINHLLLTAW